LIDIGELNSRLSSLVPLTHRSSGRATAAHFTASMVCGVQGFKWLHRSEPPAA